MLARFSQRLCGSVMLGTRAEPCVLLGSPGLEEACEKDWPVVLPRLADSLPFGVWSVT